MYYWEDFEPGRVFDLGEHTVTAEEIVTFARQWDPQPFHVDEVAAKESAFGGLIASGWHTACVFMRLYVDGLLGFAAGRGSPGLEELRWLAPVRPGDVLHATATVLETRPSSTRSDRGTVRLRWECVNGDGTPVFRTTCWNLFGRRPRGAGSDDER